MTDIKIAGAGISGLTAAINLVKAGFGVSVFEKSHDVGARVNGDFQGIENWTSDEDALSMLRRINIDTGFFNKPFRRLSVLLPRGGTVEVKSGKPVFYLVRRGGKDSLDESLKEQALSMGVNIEFNKLADDNCDIIATGPKAVRGMASGITFKTDLEDTAMLMFKDKIAPKGYAYLLVMGGDATLASVFFKDFKNARQHVRDAAKGFKGHIAFDIRNPEEFSGFCDFFMSDTAVKEGRTYIGESAGFQDYLAGFGMKYAFISGYLAAKSTIEETDYDALWKESFRDIMETTMVHRFIADRIGDRIYEFIAKRLMHDDDAREMLKRIYLPSRKSRLLYPIARFFMNRNNLQ